MPWPCTNINVCPGISDNSATIAEQPARKVFMYAQTDASEPKNELSSLWNNFLSTSTSRDVNSNWGYLTNGLFKIINKLVPVKVVCTRKYRPWLSREHRNRLHWKVKQAKSRKLHRWRHYTRYQDAPKQDIKASHNIYMDSLFEGYCENPTKKFFRAIKARRDQVGIPPLFSKRKKNWRQPLKERQLYLVKTT